MLCLTTSNAAQLLAYESVLQFVSFESLSILKDFHDGKNAEYMWNHLPKYVPAIGAIMRMETQVPGGKVNPALQRLSGWVVASARIVLCNLQAHRVLPTTNDALPAADYKKVTRLHLVLLLWMLMARLDRHLLSVASGAAAPQVSEHPSRRNDRAIGASRCRAE